MNHSRNYKYYDFILAGFVTILLCSNIIGAAKISQIGDFKFGAGILFFPISYIFGDILTEVYGYARARRVVWSGFGALIFASFMSWIIVSMPVGEGWKNQEAYNTIFGQTPRIAFASLISYWAGELTNSYTLAKLKVKTEGKHLWYRTIGSTVLGEAVDSVIFYPIAFLGVWETGLVIQVMITNYFLKVLWEVVNTPITYKVVNFLKKAESEDYFDHDTNFNPFSIDS
jgi:queuosine precursor transporter